MPTYLWIIVVIVIWFVWWIISTYNGLITWHNRVNESWSDIDVQLKRRYDLIPNLVNAVKGYAAHEKETFENVTQARTQAMGAQTMSQKAEAEDGLTGALKTLFAVAENYPQLRASENFQKLQDELTDTENKIQASRRFYNSNARDFNVKCEVFPSNLIAGKLGFKTVEFFELKEEAARTAPKVEF
ncbi:MAG: LemA family protein [Patescibacteria group bacterium]|nr:LemA family protein [Patescibacteria group bacterium]MDD5534667.1 LemA family protein [Patescibacteria group bacterium]